MSDLQLVDSIIVPEVKGFPMWDSTSSNYFCYSDANIDAKAFSIFYIYVLWPDLNRESFQKYRKEGDFIRSPNGFILETTCH